MTLTPDSHIDVVDCCYTGGSGAGEGPLTWAQQFLDKAVIASGAPYGMFDLFLIHDLSPAREVDVVRELVTRFLLRHPVLRSALVRESDGTLVQRVRANGSVQVGLLRTTNPDSSELRDLVPATTRESPIRVLFVMEGQAVVRVAVRISHLHTDADGGVLLAADLAALDAGRADDQTVSSSPLALARFEGSDSGVAVERASIAFATATYESAPPTMWTSPRRVPESPRFWFGTLCSPALSAALEALVRDHGVSRAAALASSLAVVTATCAERPSALLFLISGNRFDPDWISYPGVLAQETVLHLPVEDSFLATMRYATGATMRSLLRARYSPPAMDAAREAVEHRRQIQFDKLGSAVVLNLLAQDEPLANEKHTPTTFTWTDSTDAENVGFHLDAGATSNGFVLNLGLDSTLVAPDEAEARLRAIEWLIVSAAFCDVSTDELRARLAALRTNDCE